MSIQLLLNVPLTPGDWTRWSFAHAQVHRAISQALAANNVATVDFILDPINPQAIEEWLSRVQETHTEMNSALGLQSSDLTGVDFNNAAQTVAWIYLNWQEDNAAMQALRI